MPKRYAKLQHKQVREGHAYHSQGVLPKVPYHDEEMDFIAQVYVNQSSNPLTINLAHFQ